MPTKKTKAEKVPGKRVTTAVVVRPRTLAIYQRVSALRSAQGRIELSEAGAGRPYSVSALIREALEAHIPEMEAELRKAGIELPEGEGS